MPVSGRKASKVAASRKPEAIVNVVFRFMHPSMGSLGLPGNTGAVVFFGGVAGGEMRCPLPTSSEGLMSQRDSIPKPGVAGEGGYPG